MTTTQNRIIWLDVMRWVAMFGIVFCHAGDPFNFSTSAGTDSDFIWWGAIWGSLVRYSVPLFVMITGALLLPIHEETLGGFYKKRILRVLWPFLIWSMVYSLFPWLSSVLAPSAEAAKTAIETTFPYSTFMNDGAGASSDLISGLKLCAASLISLHNLSCHVWYVFMLIGLYLYLPIFSAWVEKASLKQKYVFLSIWGVSLLLPYAREFLAPATPLGLILGECDWNAFGTLYYFAGFNGYLLLGHVLRERFTKSPAPFAKTLAWGVPAIAIGLVATFLGFLWVRAVGAVDKPEIFTALANKNGACAWICSLAQGADAGTIAHFQRGPMVELFWQFCSIPVALVSAGTFAIIQHIRVPAGHFANFLATLAKIGFGFYLVHYLYIGVGFATAVKIGVPVWAQTPVCALITFALTYCTVYIFYKILPCRKIIFG